MSSLYELLSVAEKNKDVDNSTMATIYSKYLSAKQNSLKRPVSMQLELSPICNFQCSFCYVRKTKEEIENNGQHILRLDEWKYYIDEALKMGIQNLTLSGGECTIYPDFIELYEYAYQKGMLISLITNCSSISDDIFNLFVKYPPSRISVTLYGMSQETYEKTCKNGTAYEKVISSIHRLADRGFNVTINFTAGKDNFCDMAKVLAFARDNELSVFPNDGLFSSENCDAHMLTEKLVNHYEYDKLISEHYAILYGTTTEKMEESHFSSYSDPVWHTEKGLQCNAGKTMIHINWQGMMVVCSSFDVFSVDPRKVGFNQAYEQIKAWTKTVPLLEECEGCIFYKKCLLCPAIHYGDTGEFGKVSPRLCFKKQYPKAAAKAQAEYDRRQALKKTEETAE